MKDTKTIIKQLLNEQMEEKKVIAVIRYIKKYVNKNSDTIKEFAITNYHGIKLTLRLRILINDDFYADMHHHDAYKIIKQMENEITNLLLNYFSLSSFDMKVDCHSRYRQYWCSDEAYNVSLDTEPIYYRYKPQDIKEHFVQKLNENLEFTLIENEKSVLPILAKKIKEYNKKRKSKKFMISYVDRMVSNYLNFKGIIFPSPAFVYYVLEHEEMQKYFYVVTFYNTEEPGSSTGALTSDVPISKEEILQRFGSKGIYNAVMVHQYKVT